MDLSGRFTYANSAVERTYGWTVEEFQKLTYQNPVMIEEELLKAASPQYDRNAIRTFETKELRKDGSVFSGRGFRCLSVVGVMANQLASRRYA